MACQFFFLIVLLDLLRDMREALVENHVLPKPDINRGLSRDFPGLNIYLNFRHGLFN